MYGVGRVEQKTFETFLTISRQQSEVSTQKSLIMIVRLRGLRTQCPNKQAFQKLKSPRTSTSLEWHANGMILSNSPVIQFKSMMTSE